jgi:hypothetical protein
MHIGLSIVAKSMLMNATPGGDILKGHKRKY